MKQQEWQETTVCQAELVIRLPKTREEIRTPTPSTFMTVTNDGK